MVGCFFCQTMDIPPRDRLCGSVGTKHQLLHSLLLNDVAENIYMIVLGVVLQIRSTSTRNGGELLFFVFTEVVYQVCVGHA
jgi:hypothetical protein